eukprot:gene1415-1436_t
MVRPTSRLPRVAFYEAGAIGIAIWHFSCAEPLSLFAAPLTNEWVLSEKFIKALLPEQQWNASTHVRWSRHCKMFRHLRKLEAALGAVSLVWRRSRRAGRLVTTQILVWRRGVGCLAPRWDGRLRVLVLCMNFEDRSTSAGRFHEIAEALCRAVGNAIRPGFIDAVLAMLVVRRIQRVRGALLALEARFLAGRVLRRRDRVPVEVKVADARAPVVRVARAARWPVGFGWLCPLVPSYAATYAGHMRMVLAEPEMQALLAGCPQAVRVLGPLCRMLGIARAEYVPEGAEAPAVRVRVRAPRVVKLSRAEQRALDLAREDAHYAITQVPRKWRLRVGR